MPGTNAGTGQPLWMRCGWCRQHTGIDVARRGYAVTVTGRIAPLTSSQAGRGGSRVLSYRVEYRCDDCKRLGWSRHCDMRNKLAAAGFEAPTMRFPSIARTQMLPRAP